MSRIGRLPVDIPSGVQVDLKVRTSRVKGPKGELQRTFSPLIGIAMENGQIVITRKSDEPAERALHGTTRAVLANMVHGVSYGFRTLCWRSKALVIAQRWVARIWSCMSVIRIRSRWNRLRVSPLSRPEDPPDQGPGFR